MLGLLTCCTLLSARSIQPATPSVAVTPFQADSTYEISEPAGWTLTSPVKTRVNFTLKKNNFVVVKSGVVDVSPGVESRIEASIGEPGMLYLEVKGVDGKPRAFGAAVAPELLQPVAERPKDFDRFWDKKIKELRAIPENPKLTPADGGKEGIDYSLIEMDHVNGTKVHGQIAAPKTPGKKPAMLILLWASPPYRLWPDWITGYAEKGWLVLNIEPHNVLPTEPQSYYDALPAELKNYANINQEDKDSNYFVEMYLRGVRAVDYLTKRPDWNGKTMVVMGTSMGGQQSFAVTGLHPKVSHMIVNVPAGCDLNSPLHGHQQGYPWFNAESKKAMDTARYVDGINFASRIKASCLVSMGYVDTATPPCGIWTAFNQIRGPKEAAPMPESPHNNMATAEQQKPFKDREAAWLDALIAGKKAPVGKK